MAYGFAEEGLCEEEIRLICGIVHSKTLKPGVTVCEIAYSFV
jgi:hypothetical protein